MRFVPDNNHALLEQNPDPIRKITSNAKEACSAYRSTQNVRTIYFQWLFEMSNVLTPLFCANSRSTVTQFGSIALRDDACILSPTLAGV